MGASEKGSKLALDYGTFFEKAAYGQNGWKPPYEAAKGPAALPLGQGLTQVWWRGHEMPSSSKERLLVKVPGLQKSLKVGQIAGTGAWQQKAQN